MPKNRFSPLVTLVVGLMIAGCAHKPVKPGTAESATGAAAAPAPAISPGNPEDIVALGKRLTRNRLTLYSVAKGRYTFYVGDVLIATYESATKILRISSRSAEDTVKQVCEYSPQGVLFVDPKDQAHKSDFEDGCNQLVTRLNDYLSR